MKHFSWLLVSLFALAIGACGATLLLISQLSTGMTSPGVLVGQADGSVALYKLGSNISLDTANKTVNVTTPTSSFPTLINIPVTSTIANSFTCPSGKAPVMVSLNGLGQNAANGDFTLTAGNAVVFTPPIPITTSASPDSVQLWCF